MSSAQQAQLRCLFCKTYILIGYTSRRVITCLEVRTKIKALYFPVIASLHQVKASNPSGYIWRFTGKPGLLNKCWCCTPTLKKSFAFPTIARLLSSWGKKTPTTANESMQPTLISAQKPHERPEQGHLETPRFKTFIEEQYSWGFSPTKSEGVRMKKLIWELCI